MTSSGGGGDDRVWETRASRWRLGTGGEGGLVSGDAWPHTETMRWVGTAALQIPCDDSCPPSGIRCRWPRSLRVVSGEAEVPSSLVRRTLVAACKHAGGR
jgi:hypothetical protein